MEEQEKSLFEQWKEYAYNEKKTVDQRELSAFWDSYFEKEKEIYSQILDQPDEVISGTLSELAERFGQSLQTMVGFMDGTNDSLTQKIDLETMTEQTPVRLEYDWAVLYKNMVAAKADWLYRLPQWNQIFPKERAFMAPRVIL